MLLKKYKKIANLPKYNEGLHPFQSKYANWGGAVTGAIGTTGAIMNSFSGIKSELDLIAESGTQVGQGSGFTFSKLNNIDVEALNSELSSQNTRNTLSATGNAASLGGSIGMAFGPIGAGIGAAAGAIVGGITGLIGGASRKRRLLRKIRSAQERVQNINNYNLASAQSDYLQNQWTLEHGNTDEQEMFVANKGKNLIRPLT